jgi:hypothetical protein
MSHLISLNKDAADGKALAIPVQPHASECAFLYTSGVGTFSVICLHVCRVFGFWSLD